MKIFVMNLSEKQDWMMDYMNNGNMWLKIGNDS